MNCCNRPTTTTQKELKSGLSLYRAAAAAAEIIMMALVMMMMNDVKKKKKKKKLDARRHHPAGPVNAKRLVCSLLMMMMAIMARWWKIRRDAAQWIPLSAAAASADVLSACARARPWRSTISCPPVYKHVQHQRRHRDGGHEYSSPVHIPLLLFSSVWSPFFV